MTELKEKQIKTMNYHHLQLFWAVAREGNLTRAAGSLKLTPQTVSAQIRDFEANLDEELFRRSGRKMILTEMGHIAFRYADEIFATGRELLETFRGQPSGRPLRLVVGVADILPKRVAYRLIEPALRLREPLQISCKEGTPEELLPDLASHAIDVVLSDSPISSGGEIQAYSHQLGSCGVTFVAKKNLARRLSEDFPRSLNDAPVLLPSENTVLRQELEAWFNACGVQPVIAGEFEDSALLKVFGQAGVGFFVIPTVIRDEVLRQYEVESFGNTQKVRERFYAISMERQVHHPAVAAICDAARSELFS